VSAETSITTRTPGYKRRQQTARLPSCSSAISQKLMTYRFDWS